MLTAQFNNSFNPTLDSDSFIIKLAGFWYPCVSRAGFRRVNSGVTLCPYTASLLTDALLINIVGRADAGIQVTALFVGLTIPD
jgi:hypothetical protein